MSARIRRPNQQDFAQWCPLWQGYVEFYREPDFPEDLTKLLWQRLHDGDHPIRGFVAEDDDTGGLIGLVHYFPHPSTWEAEPTCYLEDLFVSPSVRGGGTGATLIQAVVDDAKRSGWAGVYWHTQSHNHVARGLYDKLTGGTDGFVVYRIAGGDPSVVDESSR